MLPSQTIPGSQHPDKYAGQEFQSNKAHHLPLDGTPLTLDEVQFLASVAFKCPQLAEKYQVHEVMTRPEEPKQREELPTAHQMLVINRHQKIWDYINGDWRSTREVTEHFNAIKATAHNDLNALVDAGRAEKEMRKGGVGGNFGGTAYYRAITG